MVSIEEKVLRIKETVHSVAKHRFARGDYSNPYLAPKHKAEIRLGMQRLYEEEMFRLINERVCPTCGQSALGDLN